MAVFLFVSLEMKLICFGPGEVILFGGVRVRKKKFVFENQNSFELEKKM